MFRSKSFYRMLDFEKVLSRLPLLLFVVSDIIFYRLTLKYCKGTPKPVPTIFIDEKCYVAPVGVLFFKITKGVSILLC